MNDDLITISNHNEIDKLTNSNEIAKEQQEERRRRGLKQE